MLRRCCAALACGAALWWLDAGASANPPCWHVGEETRVFHPAALRHWRGAQTQALVTRIWYPADPALPESMHEIGAPGDPIFQGHHALDDAPLSTAQEIAPVELFHCPWYRAVMTPQPPVITIS